MRIVYVPVDERPCNVDYVKRIAASNPEVELIVPEMTMLGYKKQAADTEKLWNWLKLEAASADAFILSIDMLVYGGLLPSRIHHLPAEAGELWKNRLQELRGQFPQLPLYAFNLIMRTPKYSSSDEEPDYYENWGREIFLRAYLRDKHRREGLTAEETAELQDIESRLPHAYIEDYEGRREFNSRINMQMLELVQEGVITFLSIPQDDSAEFGYTAIDQQKVIQLRNRLRLQQQVHMYPGADEAGATLLARVYNSLKGQRPSIFPLWSSTLGPQLVPMYEDRPFAESLKAHVLAAGCRLVDRAEDAYLILAYNVPGRMMQESWEQQNKDITYNSFRNLLTFIDRIKEFAASGKKVMIADSAFANGGDWELLTMLDEERLLDSLISYKGWNTNCNTLGTTICQGVLGMNGLPDMIQENVLYHVLDDYVYQAEIRMEMVHDFLPEHGLSYFDLQDKADAVNRERDSRMYKRYRELLVNSFPNMELVELTSFAPWNRMFECGLSMQVNRKEGD